MEFDKLKQVIASVLNVDPNEIELETTFMEDLGADSLDVYQIMMGVEDEFDITLDPQKVEEIRTVEEALALLKASAPKDNTYI
ncbi:MAG: acyl carrier protein [Lachnospiraceae bacterium]|nr:acyl carrier protein [Lachnospiraceae bacterium]MDE7239181.1 acyl carrier protein [Lachnospiraceae bacterium]